MRNRVKNRIAKFRINPGKWNPFKPDSKHYYYVHVFSDKESMWAFGAKLSAREKDQHGGYEALTVPIWRERYTEDEQVIKAPKIGDVLFYQGRLGSECICHESVHLATNYLRVIDRLYLGDQIDDDEELLAYSVGSCARQIVDRLYQLKIL